MRLRLQPMPDSDYQAMHEAVLRLLDEFGVLFEHDQARKMLADAGNPVDGAGRVHLQPAFVEKMLALVPKDGFMMYGADESKELRVAVDSLAFRPSTGAPFILDYATRRRRPATMEDARTMAILTDELDGYDMVNNVVTPSSAPAGKDNVRLFALAHNYSGKPSDITVMTGEEVRAIARIASAIRGGAEKLREKPLTAVDVAMITPLRCAGDQVDALLECAKWGVPIEILTSPAMALTGPVTLAGCAALAVAEHIAAMCLVYLAAPGLGMICTSRVSPTNMRTTSYNYGTPDLGKGSVVVAEYLARHAIPTNQYGFGTIAKMCGAQAEMEKLLSGLPMIMSRPHMITGSAILDNAMLTSPEQLVIDNETIRLVKHVLRPIEVTAESIGVDAIMEAMPTQGTMLAEEHTINYLRKGELVDCGLDQWEGYDEWLSKGAPDLFERAHEKVEEILAKRVDELFPPGLEEEIDRILDEEFGV